jgi:pimeloyl-ACP methyl ester carboxylesterase
MGYSSDFFLLRQLFNQEQDKIIVPGTDISIRNMNFRSAAEKHLPGNDYLPETERKALSVYSDTDIRENNQFTYPVFVSGSSVKFNKAIVLLHGLNERNWDKYLYWAKYLVENTGKPVILFPIAFHMNRTPKAWTNPRSMSVLLQERLKKYPDDNNASFANAALSERLCNMPERFVYSGFQSIVDIIDLLRDMEQGRHPLFEKGTKADIFGYSIGAFLTQILMIANPENLLGNSKFALFCGGAVFSQMNGISRYIMDSIAFGKLYAFYMQEKNWKKTSGNFRNIIKSENIGMAFMAMLAPGRLRKFREQVFEKLNRQVQAVSLLKDKIIPGKGIYETLKGSRNKIPINVKITDMPFQYTHENPFPIFTNPAACHAVDRSFEQIFCQIAGFLK